MAENLPAPRATNNAPATLSVFSTMEGFESAQRMARALAASALVPDAYRGESNLPNVLIAMEYAGKCGMSVLAVMQNLHVIQGRPSWSAPFLISSVNATGKFTPLRYERQDRGKGKAEIVTWSGPSGNRSSTVKVVDFDDFAYRAWATDKSTGEKLYGPWVSMKMAHEEGWTSRNGNKYRTMPDQMLMYRSASFFTRLYCPEVSMGMHTSDEAVEYVEYEDMTPAPAAAIVVEAQNAPKGASRVNSAVRSKKEPAPAAEAPIIPEPQHVTPEDVEQLYNEPDGEEYGTEPYENGL
jgi:hypothetical protein